jgi:sterol desaturase/sphingolipid hydroxylase (fatty acid hydroxylase superfamily)
MQLAIMLAVIFAISGVFIRAISAFAVSEVARRHRTRQDRPSRVDPATHRKSSIANSVVSTALIVGVPMSFRSHLFVSEPVGALRALAEATAILLIYDLGYYLLHRFVLHEWSVGRRIHAVHHTIRTPYASDSLYIHPAETVAGVALFLGSTAIIGPVGLASFGLAFLVYSLLNVFIHSAVDLRFFPFRSLTALVRHHDVHHDSMKSGYYASITPVWDLVLGTAGPPGGRRGQGG